MSQTLSRSLILNTPAPKPSKLDVPEFGDGTGHVFVKSLSTKEREKYENSLFDKKGRPTMKGARVRLVILATVNERGLPVFTQGDAEVLEALPAAGVDRIAKKAMELCGMSEADIEAEAEVFDEAHGDDSSSE